MLNFAPLFKTVPLFAKAGRQREVRRAWVPLKYGWGLRLESALLVLGGTERPEEVFAVTGSGPL